MPALQIPKHLLARVAAAAHAHDRLSALHLYDVHFIVQDTDFMKFLRGATRDALRAGVTVVSRYDRDGVDVSFLNERLADAPWQSGKRSLFSPDEVGTLQWEARGERALVGNVVESLVGEYIKSLQQGARRKPVAFIVISADAMADAPVLADALKMAKRSLGDSQSAQICVGLLPLRKDAGGDRTAAWLDDHGDVADMVEADLNTQQPVQERLENLLHGMLDKCVDRPNNLRNKTAALASGFKRLMGGGR